MYQCSNFAHFTHGIVAALAAGIVFGLVFYPTGSLTAENSSAFLSSMHTVADCVWFRGFSIWSIGSIFLYAYSTVYTTIMIP